MRLFLFLSTVALLHASPLKSSKEELIKEYAEHHPNPDPDGIDLEYGELYQGDIIRGPMDDSPPVVDENNAVINKNRLWEDGVIYYQLAEDTYDEEQIEKIEWGIFDLVNRTMVDGELCVDIRKRQDQENPEDVSDWILVGKFGGCSSLIGCSRIGMQTMSLEDSCVNRHGTIMHEFLHAFGFYHEQSRGDRDDYVTINFDNIQDGYANNFIKYEDGVTIDHQGTWYDYGSVLHYSAYAFAIDPEIPTIVPHDPDAEIGQRTHLSECDIERVKLLYGCIEPEDAMDCMVEASPNF